MTITVDFRAGERGPLAAIGRVSLDIITPLQKAVASIFRPIGSFFSTIANIPSLRAENARLKTELAGLRGDRAAFADRERRIGELEALLDLKSTLNLFTRGARVIAESPSNFEEAVFIDRGSADGVALDMPVMAADGLVGRVVKVTRSSAKVMLIIDPESHVGVRLAKSGETGDLVGGRGDELRLNLVEPETEVLPSEPVVTSGFTGSLFPPGIPVGEVTVAKPSELGLSKEVLVRPNVDFSRLEYVLLVLPHADVGSLGN